MKPIICSHKLIEGTLQGISTGWVEIKEGGGGCGLWVGGDAALELKGTWAEGSRGSKKRVLVV